MRAWSSPGCLVPFCPGCLLCISLPAAALRPPPCASCLLGAGPSPGRPFSGNWAPTVCLLAVLVAFSMLNGLPASLWSLLHAPWGRDVYLLVLAPEGFLFPSLGRAAPSSSGLGFSLASVCVCLGTISPCCQLCSSCGVLDPSLAGSPHCSSRLPLLSCPSGSSRFWLPGAAPLSLWSGLSPVWPFSLLLGICVTFFIAPCAWFRDEAVFRTFLVASSRDRALAEAFFMASLATPFREIAFFSFLGLFLEVKVDLISGRPWDPFPRALGLVRAIFGPCHVGRPPALLLFLLLLLAALYFAAVRFCFHLLSLPPKGGF